MALNFLSFISGVATTTKKFVDKIKGKNCKICCTRKTTPALRSIQKYGVRLGGGLNHRFNLSDEILIKDNHIAIDGNIKKFVQKAIKNRKKKKITVEVDNLSQLKKIIGLKFNRVLLDNMNAKNLKIGVKLWPIAPVAPVIKTFLDGLLLGIFLTLVQSTNLSVPQE